MINIRDKFKEYSDHSWKLEWESDRERICGFAAYSGLSDLIWILRDASRESLQTENVFICAVGSPIEEGFDMMKGFIGLYGDKSRSLLCSVAARECKLLRLKWLYNKGFKIDEMTFDNAVCQEDNMDMIEWLFKVKCPRDFQEICDDAAGNGYMQTLKFLVENGGTPKEVASWNSKKSLENAKSTCHSIEVIEWLEEWCLSHLQVSEE